MEPFSADSLKEAFHELSVELAIRLRWPLRLGGIAGYSLRP